jgi:hypothetical protein
MGLHLEISKIRLARKADSRVQPLSSGNLPLAGFEVTPEEHEWGGIAPASLTRVRREQRKPPLRYRRTDPKPTNCAGGFPEPSIASRAGAQPKRVLTLNILYPDSEEVPCEEYVRFTQTKSSIVEDNTQQ